MCLSISGEADAPRITDVRTFHCGEFPGTFAALFRIKNNNNNNKERGTSKTTITPPPDSAAQRAGPIALISDEFL